MGKSWRETNNLHLILSKLTKNKKINNIHT